MAIMHLLGTISTKDWMKLSLPQNKTGVVFYFYFFFFIKDIDSKKTPFYSTFTWELVLKNSN
jgi:hypothetical protein